MTDTIKLVHKLISITHTPQIKLVELASMHTGLYISEKTTKPLSTTLAWTSAIFILPGYTYLPPGMDLALVLGSNHVLVLDTHTYIFTIQTDSCNNIIKRACRYIPIWYHRTRCGFQHDVSTSQHACTHSDLPNPTQTTKPNRQG